MLSWRPPPAAAWPAAVARLGVVVAHSGEIHPSAQGEVRKVHRSRPPRALSLTFQKADIFVVNRQSSTRRSADPTAGGWVSPARAAFATRDSPSLVPRSPFPGLPHLGPYARLELASVDVTEAEGFTRCASKERPRHLLGSGFGFADHSGVLIAYLMHGLVRCGGVAVAAR